MGPEDALAKKKRDQGTYDVFISFKLTFKIRCTVTNLAMEFGCST